MDPTLTLALAQTAARLDPPARALLRHLVPSTRAAGRPTGSTTNGGVPRPDEGDPATRIGPADPSPAIDDDPGAAAFLAIAMAATARERSGQLLAQLPVPLAVQVLARLASDLRATDGSDNTAAWGPALARALGHVPDAAPGLAAAILRQVADPERQRQLLGALALHDAALVAQVQAHLFVFADLMRLPDVELQVLLGSVDNSTLARAMQVCPTPLRRRLQANMSARRLSMVTEEEEREAAADPAQIEAAQDHVLAAVRELFERGRLKTYLGSIGRLMTTATEPANGKADEDLGSWGVAPPPRWSRRAGAGIAALLVAVALGMWAAGHSPSAPGEDRAGGGQRGGEGGVANRGGTPLAAAVPPGPADGARPAVGATDAAAPTATAAPSAQLEIPGLATLEAPPAVLAELDPTSHVASVDSVFLRFGALRTTVRDRPFRVHTPVLVVSGQPGAVFSTVVRLDGTTAVSVENGSVAVAGQGAGAAPWPLRDGERLTCAPDGTVEVNR